jgi:MscS family membrane protein
MTRRPTVGSERATEHGAAARRRRSSAHRPPRVAALLLTAVLATLGAAPLAAQANPTVAPQAVTGASATAEPTREAVLAQALRERAEKPRRWVVDLLPQAWREKQVLGLFVWQWLVLALLPLAAWALAWLIDRAARPLLRSITARTPTRLDDAMIRALEAPVRVALFVLFLAVGLPIADLPLAAGDLLKSLLIGMAVAAVAWIALRAIDVSADSALARMAEEQRPAMTSVVHLGRRAGRIFVFAIAFLVLLANLGVNVSALIAGLGVGGIAVALAAQKTVENVFGGISVIADQTVRVGDFCEFSPGKVGTVEKIGLRSTWIRTLDRTLVTIPNADFSLRQIENYAHRDRMRVYTVIGLRYETSPDQLRSVLAGLRRLLEAHPRVSSDPRRVRFVGFGASSLEVEVFAYILTADYSEFLALREEIYLSIIDVVREAGSAIAFPSQTLYLGRDGGLDPDRSDPVTR